jgi:type II secretory pathway pseudopilin PulG
VKRLSDGRPQPVVLAAGFTLIEIAIAVFIMALLLGTLMVPLTTQVNQKGQSDVRKQLIEVSDALLGFLAAYGYLPCPDTDGDGLENVTGASCTAAEGNFPFATLGVANQDPWGQLYRFRVTPAFAQRPSVIALQPPTAGAIRICTSAACTTVLSNDAAAVIVSLGRNLGNCAGTCTDEDENTDNDTTFVSHTVTDAGTGAGEFDDYLIWLTPSTVFNRLITAERLP